VNIIKKKKRYTMNKKLTAIIEREGNGFVALCPELDVASQGDTIDEARKNLQEALELFFETASPEEVKTRLHDEVYVTQVEVAVG
jgi:predicted RNase H-like HicB family nuclease